MNSRVPRSERHDIHHSVEEWEKMLKRVDELRADGVPKTEIARRLRVSYSALNEHLKKREVADEAGRSS
jgi:predicted nuclease with TOPRIM domain